MSKKDEALKLAQDLRTLADRFSEGWHDGIKIDASDIMLLTDAAATLASEAKEQPAQPQEPFGYFRYDLRLDAWVQNRAGLTGTPFYTSPPASKPWVGLTPEDKQRVINNNFGGSRADCMDEAEKILREKNT